MTAICNSFSIDVVYRTLFYGHSVRTLFWMPETIKVFGCGGES